MSPLEYIGDTGETSHATELTGTERGLATAAVAAACFRTRGGLAVPEESLPLLLLLLLPALLLLLLLLPPPIVLVLPPPLLLLLLLLLLLPW